MSSSPAENPTSTICKNLLASLNTFVLLLCCLKGVLVRAEIIPIEPGQVMLPRNSVINLLNGSFDATTNI
jgi:hypothetical protein